MLAILFSSLLLPSVAFGQAHVDVIEVDGIINPISSRFIKEAIEKATEDGAECLIIELDTPGGLMKSMRSIVKEILSSPVPIVVYVSPSGSRAGSAGVFVTLAAHVAAMAPGTNIGAAHPVTMGGVQDTTGTMAQKITNDAVAYIKTIAEKRGRNADWAEKAVRVSASITEKEALELHVIDLICKDIRGLLDRIDGRKVDLPGGVKVLKTEGAEVRRRGMSWRYRVLDKISDPNIAYILLLLGIYGLFFELANPGAILPGVVGAIFLILAFFAFQTLPINYAGLLLILLAIVLFIAETQITSYGLLSIGGAVAMILGSMMLFNTGVPFLKVSWNIIVPAVAATVAFFLFAVGMGLRAQRRKPATGAEGLVGTTGVALTRIAPEGKVSIHGEIWRARSDEKIKKGEEVVVVGVEHLKLRVSKPKDES
ncbi:MAG TPA: nodulation protein NfeD [Candidatus Latescibacteria bacterium]|nr:nodulation protein NfeD [Candidatus Latescibacterota bacterium]